MGMREKSMGARVCVNVLLIGLQMFCMLMVRKWKRKRGNYGQAEI